MGPDDLKALLAKATARPWQHRVHGWLDMIFTGEYFISAENGPRPQDAAAIVAVLNRAELLVELWAACCEEEAAMKEWNAAMDSDEETEVFQKRIGAAHDRAEAARNKTREILAKLGATADRPEPNDPSGSGEG